MSVQPLIIGIGLPDVDTSVLAGLYLEGRDY